MADDEFPQLPADLIDTWADVPLDTTLSTNAGSVRADTSTFRRRDQPLSSSGVNTSTQESVTTDSDWEKKARRNTQTDSLGPEHTGIPLQSDADRRDDGMYGIARQLTYFGVRCGFLFIVVQVIAVVIICLYWLSAGNVDARSVSDQVILWLRKRMNVVDSPVEGVHESTPLPILGTVMGDIASDWDSEEKDEFIGMEKIPASFEHISMDEGESFAWNSRMSEPETAPSRRPREWFPSFGSVVAVLSFMVFGWSLVSFNRRRSTTTETVSKSRSSSDDKDTAAWSDQDEHHPGPSSGKEKKSPQPRASGRPAQKKNGLAEFGLGVEVMFLVYLAFRWVRSVFFSDDKHGNHRTAWRGRGSVSESSRLQGREKFEEELSHFKREFRRLLERGSEGYRAFKWWMGRPRG